MADERFLVTGGTGCIGSWVVRGSCARAPPSRWSHRPAAGTGWS